MRVAAATALGVAATLALGACATGPRGFTPDADDGQVDLACAVNVDGSVSSCTVELERPLGMGLGDKALEAAMTARLSPRSVDGVATGGRVRFTLRFQMENGVLVEPPEAPEPWS